MIHLQLLKKGTSFLKLEESVHLLTPLGDDPMPNDVRQSTPNSWWTSPDVKPSISQAECKVTNSVTNELSKQWKIASPKKITPAPETFVAPPEPVKPLEPAQKPPGIEANNSSDAIYEFEVQGVATALSAVLVRGAPKLQAPQHKQADKPKI
ncbi:uncharacterized protein TNCV_3662901 [Trichonephila clavipes]|nr:uncharacterized protein TNCV_3662901 [Trichonephila clavipes]